MLQALKQTRIEGYLQYGGRHIGGFPVGHRHSNIPQETSTFPVGKNAGNCIRRQDLAVRH